MTNEEIRSEHCREGSLVLLGTNLINEMQNEARTDERQRIIKIITNEMSGANINKSISTEITTLRDNLIKLIND